MITRFRVQNYKALRDVSLELTQFHVLIGPNDSGKTSILHALSALGRSVDLELPEAFGGMWDGRELVWHDDVAGIVAFHVDFAVDSREFQYSLACRFPNVGRNVRIESERATVDSGLELTQKDHGQSFVRAVCTQNAGATAEIGNACHIIHGNLSGVHYFRWNPRTLALPVAPDAARQFRLNSDGFGLALLLDDILGYDRTRFTELESRFRKIFPEITSIKLQRQKAFRAPPDDRGQVSKLEQADGKGLFFEVLESPHLVPASQVSDGAMLVLGYLAILFSPRVPRLLLIEEPENGIHPQRLSDVLTILREIVKSAPTTQVVMTTHSPYAVSLFEADEVTLCTKKNGAVRAKRLSDSKLVKEQSSIFTLGEIWTAEGDEELAEDHTIARS